MKAFIFVFCAIIGFQGVKAQLAKKTWSVLLKDICNTGQTSGEWNFLNMVDTSYNTTSLGYQQTNLQIAMKETSKEPLYIGILFAANATITVTHKSITQTEPLQCMYFGSSGKTSGGGSSNDGGMTFTSTNSGSSYTMVMEFVGSSGRSTITVKASSEGSSIEIAFFLA